MKKFACTFISTIILTTLIIFLLTQTPKSISKDTSTELEKEALTIITDIIGLDKTKYNITLQKHFSEIWGGVCRDHIHYTLESQSSKVRVMQTYANSILIQYKVDPLEGTPLYARAKTNKTVDTVKETLQRYQTYTNLQVIQEALNILKTINELEPNEVTAGNLKMRISKQDSFTNINWIRTINGLEFSTGLGIRLTNESIDTFTDRTRFFKIGSSEVNISQEEAISIALEEAKTFTAVEISFGNGVKVFPFQVKEEPWRARLDISTNNFTMYPCWEIRFAADPIVYSVYGVAVYLRADTGEIFNSFTTSCSPNFGISLEEEN